MIDPQTLNLNSLPSVPLERRNELPQIACIYLALDRNKVVQYVGKTARLRSRWEAHHKGVDLALQGGIEIAYVEVSNIELLPAVEKALIQYFKPPLNSETEALLRKEREEKERRRIEDRNKKAAEKREGTKPGRGRGRPGGNPEIKEYGFKTTRKEPLSQQINIRVPKSMEARLKEFPHWQELVRKAIEKELNSIEEAN